MVFDFIFAIFFFVNQYTKCQAVIVRVVETFLNLVFGTTRRIFPISEVGAKNFCDYLQ